MEDQGKLIAFGQLVFRLFEMHAEAADLPEWATVDEAAITFSVADHDKTYSLSLKEVEE